MDFQSIIKTRRRQLNISQRELAQRANTTQQLIARYEAGTEPKLNAGLAILRALNYDWSELSVNKLSYYQSLLNNEKYDLQYEKETNSYVINVRGTTLSFSEKDNIFEQRLDEIIESITDDTEDYIRKEFNSKFNQVIADLLLQNISLFVKYIRNPANSENKLLLDINEMIVSFSEILKDKIEIGNNDDLRQILTTIEKNYIDIVKALVDDKNNKKE